jgi:hypothetical protein
MICYCVELRKAVRVDEAVNVRMYVRSATASTYCKFNHSSLSGLLNFDRVPYSISCEATGVTHQRSIYTTGESEKKDPFLIKVYEAAIFKRQNVMSLKLKFLSCRQKKNIVESD